MSESPNLGLLILTLTRDVTTKGWGSLLSPIQPHTRVYWDMVRFVLTKKKLKNCQTLTKFVNQKL